ncbi:MAG: putative oxidoreductase C-terminal domain-containing protein [Candidatus Rokuibacteriota bacterium]
MRRLLFLEPGHFHAALTLRMPHPALADEIVVYSSEGPELRDFLALVDRFNRRSESPTRWRPVVVTCLDSLPRLVEERRGDVVVLAGKNGGKARTIQRLHASGFHVLADKPWLVKHDDLVPIQASLDRWPLVAEIMTGRHDTAARLLQRLVGTPDVFGGFRAESPAFELESVHHLEKLVDGAPLRRPWWFFDVRVQGSGAVDIPTHQVDMTQWLVNGAEATSPAGLRLLSARAWPTSVPVEAFRRITGHPTFPPELQPRGDGDTLSYLCNAELSYQIGGVVARASARWDLVTPPGGGDSSRAVAHGTRADVCLEQGALTGHQRWLTIQSPSDANGVARALRETVTAWQAEFPGVSVEPDGAGRHRITIPPMLATGHESHFARVLDEFLRAVDEHRWPAERTRRTLAKYTLLAEAAAAVSLQSGDRSTPP